MIYMYRWWKVMIAAKWLSVKIGRFYYMQVSWSFVRSFAWVSVMGHNFCVSVGTSTRNFKRMFLHFQLRWFHLKPLLRSFSAESVQLGFRLKMSWKVVAFILTSQTHGTGRLHILGLSIYTGQGMAGPTWRDGTEFHLGDDRIYASLLPYFSNIC